MLYITDLSDPAFHPIKVLTVLQQGCKIILITKNPQRVFQILENVPKALLENVLVQVTVTGLGASVWEPRVLPKEEAYNGTSCLVSLLGAKKVTLRYDPLIPNVNDDPKFYKPILSTVRELGVTGVVASVVDMYPHSQQRIRAAGLPLPFNGFQYDLKANLLSEFWANAVTLGFEVRICCEQGFDCGARGCDFPDRLLTSEEMAMQPKGKQRANCRCPQYVQLLSYADQCGHGCLYCYRKN